MSPSRRVKRSSRLLPALRSSAAKSVYSTLSNDQIRLLTITHNVREKLVSELKVFNVDSLPEFDALSYTWGSSCDTKPFICNGQLLEIGANLHEAIRTLYSRPVLLVRPIWIDAVCINQRDDDEKGHQVRRMADIYKRAHRVVVWLGPSENSSDIAMDAMEGLATALPLVPHSLGHSELSKCGLPDTHDPLWRALGHLVRREWFGRLWTFQEVVLATDILMVCGQKTIDWKSLAGVAVELKRLYLAPVCFGLGRVPRSEDGLEATGDVSFARRNLKDNGYLLFSDLLVIGRSKLVTDARDRVYGMLGLASEAYNERIPISYANEASQIHIDCARSCIEEEANFQILGLIAGQPKVPGQPSWCPNLDSTQSTITRFGQYLHAGITGSNQKTSTLRPAKMVSQSNVLFVTGFRVDIVDEIVGGTFYWPNVTSDRESQRAQRFLDWESHCLNLAQRIYKSPHGTAPMGHLFTLTGNTRATISEEQEEVFLKSYFDVMGNERSMAQHGNPSWPPADRQVFFQATWRQISHTCRGRRYFSTEGGRVGIGPPEIEKGDIVCVFYDASPVFVLHPAHKDQAKGWLLQGDAFLHGFMELDETPMSDRGPDEVFNIF